MGAALATNLTLEIDDGRLDELLGIWARSFDNFGPLRALWFPDGAAGCVGGGYSQTFEDMLDAKEAREVMAMDGAIDSLEPIQQCAIYHVHMHAVYRFARAVEHIYAEAREALRIALPMRGVY